MNTNKKTLWLNLIGFFALAACGAPGLTDIDYPGQKLAEFSGQVTAPSDSTSGRPLSMAFVWIRDPAGIPGRVIPTPAGAGIEPVCSLAPLHGR
jgi:hypothetical protein